MDIDFIIPCLNSERTLPACLESIYNLKTDDHNIFVYVVDNGSIDKTKEIVREFSQAKLVEASPKSRSVARNAGIKVSTSPLVAFIDSDVVLDSNWLVEILKVFRSPMVGGSQGGIITAGEDTLLNRYRYYRKKQSTFGSFNSLEYTYTYPLINTAACLYRRSALKKVNGFDEDFINEDRCEDLDLTLRVVVAGYSLVGANNALAKVFYDDGWIGYFKRTYYQSFSHYKLTRSRYGGELSLPFGRVFLNIFKIQKFFLINLINNMIYFFGATAAHIKIPSRRAMQKWAHSKINLSFPILEVDGKNYRFSLNHRIVLGGRCAKILGPRTKTTLRYVKPTQIEFIKNALYDQLVDFNTDEPVLIMLHELIDEKVLIEV